MKFLTVVALLSLVSFSALAQERVGTIKQALGEQCSVIANYQEAEAGGSCGGNGEVQPGDAQVSGMMTVEKYKSYYARFTLINQNDEIAEVVETEVYTATRDDNWVIDNYYLSLSSFGKYAIKMEVFNASTGVAVCTNQALINAAK